MRCDEGCKYGSIGKKGFCCELGGMCISLFAMTWDESINRLMERCPLKTIEKGEL